MQNKNLIKKLIENKILKNIFLFALIYLSLLVVIPSNASAKTFVIQNESVNQFVVNGSSGNIILNPNAGFGNVGINTTNPSSLLQVAGTANITSSSTQLLVNSNGDVVINLKG